MFFDNLLAKYINIINSYIQFAAAIVNSGIAAHDEVFLKSEWCQELIDAVVDFHNNGTDDNNNIHSQILSDRVFLNQNVS